LRFFNFLGIMIREMYVSEKSGDIVYRIFIVEDDPGIALGVKKQLEQWDLEVTCAEDFRDIMGSFAACQPHLVILDISLPFFNGFYWCGEIRKISKVPILFLSSAGDNMNMVMAMNMGADDFIPKPFEKSLLLAKVQAMLRRAYDFSESMPVLEHKGAFLSTGDTQLTYNGKQIALTKNEYRILLTLMENKGKVVSREKLMERLWETDSFVDENTLTVNVNRLRKKLKEAGLSQFITTRFGVGYVVE
jgi:two-component system response regulator protein BraR/BceR